MKKSGYRVSYHIYLVFIIAVITSVMAMLVLALMIITIQTPSGKLKRSNWPQLFAKEFKEQLYFEQGQLMIKQSGVALLEENQIGLQVLDDTGNEVLAFHKPKNIEDHLNSTALLGLIEQGYTDAKDPVTVTINKAQYDKKEYICIMYFPISIHKVSMYLNGESFTSGKYVLGLIVGIVCVVVIIVGSLYGMWVSKTVDYLITSIKQISNRSYVGTKQRGVFKDLVNSINELDIQIRASDHERQKTEIMRKEWIANICHDLKTPLSPIKGYAEMMKEGSVQDEEEWKHYGSVIHKNALYMEQLIEDLKWTYQLESGMLPIQRKKQNFVPVFREWVIDVLNRPEYENRQIQLETVAEEIWFEFDEKLLMRAFQNLMINALVHGGEETAIEIQITKTEGKIELMMSDNGKGMTEEETKRLFERYYRGANTEKKIEGTGLGMAITKSIIELHNGRIRVRSRLQVGTTFFIDFPVN